MLERLAVNTSIVGNANKQRAVLRDKMNDLRVARRVEGYLFANFGMGGQCPATSYRLIPSGNAPVLASARDGASDLGTGFII
jgi:hypothetical protein